MTLRDYPCGVMAGDIIQLRADLHYHDDQEQPMGKVRHAGHQAVVLPGNCDEPNVIWIRWRDGERQTWDDTILDDFDRVGIAV